MTNYIFIALLLVTAYANWALSSDLSQNIQQSHDRGRNEEQYFLDMDASFNAKWQLIVPAIKDYKSNNTLTTICDVGTGTGLMAFKLAEHFSSSNVTIIGTDIMPTYVKLASQKYSLPNLSFHLRSTEEPCVDLSSKAHADIVIFSSVLHEAYSYGEDGDSLASLKRAIANAHKSLALHGRIIIRDFVAPDSKQGMQPLVLRHRRDDIKATLYRGSPRELTCANFADDFRAIRNKGLTTRQDIRCKEIEPCPDDFRCYETNLATAYEFMYRKDFEDSYEAELNERYGFLSLPDATQLLEETGFSVLVGQSFKNDWIQRNRLDDAIALSSPLGEEVGIPDYQMFIVAEKTVH